MQPPTLHILHTSDWHIGRTLYGHQRYAEFAAFLTGSTAVRMSSSAELAPCQHYERTERDNSSAIAFPSKGGTALPICFTI
ncbi:MAG: hypothetical protein D3906_03755 [Candidatus Electrothrix sp. AUS1_2]|nr:hypothetical protein [Candidatus Electrothrix sp. AUS1_2]